MVSKDLLRKNLPPIDGEDLLIVQVQNDKDIINEIIAVHEEFAPDYDLIAPYFDTGYIVDDCEKIWNFLKNNLPYKAETELDQTSKSPGRILTDGEKIDCKHYSLFIAGCIDSIQRNNPGDWDWFYRFASYNHEKVAAHVYVVVVDENDEEIWIDPVLDWFNEDKAPTYIKDIKPMALHRLSGIDKEVAVPVSVSWPAFLVLLNQNTAGIKDLMLSNVNVTYGAFKQWCAANGCDFNHFLLVLHG